MERIQPVKNKIANRRSIRLAVIVTLLLVSVLFVKAVMLRRQNLELQRKQEALAESLAKAESENAELKEKKNRGFTEEELFEIARKRFGLVFPNEILFIPED